MNAADKSRKWRANNPAKQRAIQDRSNLARRGNRQAEHLNRLYKMSPSDVLDLLAEQGGCCAICGTTQPTKNGGAWRIDHDHNCCSGDKNSPTCGKCVRGILCARCNTALGGFKDDPLLLNRAIDYLKRRLG